MSVETMSGKAYQFSSDAGLRSSFRSHLIFSQSFFHLINGDREARLLQQRAQRLTDESVLFASVNLAK